MKRRIIITLERSCGAIDRLPGVWRDGKSIRFVRHAQYGCSPLRIADFALRLEQRWFTS